VEKYRLTLDGTAKSRGFLKKLQKKAEKCGGIKVSVADVLIEGENGDLTKLIAWLTHKSRLKNLRYLRRENPSEK
jgi:hypothetical protein